MQVLTLEDDPYSSLKKMSEGNPGALTVLMNIMQVNHEDYFMVFLNLDSMGVRGSRIWLGYKDYCNQDINAFVQLALTRDDGMVQFINKIMGE